nr:alpha/beta fold hydrolase [Janibacter melonis]
MSELTYDSTSRMVQTRQWRIHVNEAGSGPAVFLLHGSGPGATGWSNFSQNIPALARDHRVIAVDMPGWGESDP